MKASQVLFYRESAPYWEAALPIGNGRLGAIPEARRLIAERKFSEADAFISTHMGDHDSQSYLPAGDLNLRFRHAGPIENYQRKLDLSNALFSMEYTAGGISFQREAFASSPAQTIVYRITAGTPGAVNLEAEFAHRRFMDRRLLSARTSSSTANVPFTTAEIRSSGKMNRAVPESVTACS